MHRNQCFMYVFGSAMRLRAVALHCILGAAALSALLASSALASTAPRFRQIARRDVVWVAASGHYAFFITDRVGRVPSGIVTVTSSRGTLINQLTGKRSRLVPPNCPRYPWGALFGGPWLLIECITDDSSGVVPLLSLYDLASGTWETVEPAETAPPPVETCAEAFDSSGGCQVVGVGERWIEFETNCYHCANEYFLQPIPSGQPVEPAAVTPGGSYAFDLNAASGTAPLCAPLTYPGVPFYPAGGGVLTQPGWIDPLGTVAVVATTYPAPQGGSGADVFLARCGKRTRKRLPLGAIGPAIARSAIAWWDPKHKQVRGLRLPNGRPFRLPLPAKFKYNGFTPIVAVSDHDVYFKGDGRLWQARLPR